MPRRLAIAVLVVVLTLLLPLTAVAQIGSAFGNVYSLSAQLRGDTEVPPGDPDGFGYARITILLDSSELCFQTSVARIDPATASHIHSGVGGSTGPVVIPLGTPSPEGLINGCVEADAALLTDIVSNPWNYYVNVHNAEYPAGAIRGQLEASGHQAPPPPPPAEPEIVVVADGLNNPRGVDWAADGALHVAETGSGGDECYEVGTPDEPFELCFGMTGAVSMVVDGVVEQVGDSLPSSADETGTFSTGPHDTATDAGGNVYVVVGLGASAADRDSLGSDVASMGGKLYMLADDGSWTEVADLAAYEDAENPDDGEVPDSNPYGVAVDGDTILVADAGGNDLLAVAADGTVSTFAVFPSQMVDAPPFLELPEGTQIPAESVPTSVAVGPDGAYYVGELTGFPFPVDGARVWRLEDLDGDGDALEEGEMTVFASGFTSIIDLEFGADGTLYVVELAKNGLLAAEMAPPEDVEAVTGAIIAVHDDGSMTEIASNGLILPGGVAVAEDNSLYVTNYSVFSDVGDMTGQLVHVMMLE